MNIIYPTHPISVSLGGVLCTIGRWFNNRIVFRLDSKNFNRRINPMNFFVRKNIEKIAGVNMKKDDGFTFKFENDDYKVFLNRKDSEIYLTCN